MVAEKAKKAKKEKKKTVEPVEIVVIVDRSGSMFACQGDAEGGLNAFLAEQRKVKAPGRITLAQFDTEYELIHDGIDIKTVPDYKLNPRYSTALYDAIGRTVTTVQERQDLTGFTGKTVVAIVTDGMENSSHEWTGEGVKALIAERKEKGWEFAFLAASEEAMGQGTFLGTQAFNTSKTTYHAAYAAVGNSTSMLRQAGPDVVCWSAENSKNLTDAGAVEDQA